MQNKPNFQDTQMNVSNVKTRNYQNLSRWRGQKTNPIQTQFKPNFQKAQMNISSLITKDYRKKDDFAVQKNKPNSNPISSKPKMSANLYVIEDYENETAFRLQKNKPKQSQSLVKDLIALVSSRMFIRKTVKKSCASEGRLIEIDLKHSFYGSAFYFEFYKTEPRP